MQKAVEVGLNFWRQMNKLPNTWASFEAVQFPSELIVAVHVGNIYHKGTEHEFKEIAYKVRKFTATEDGTVRHTDFPQL